VANQDDAAIAPYYRGWDRFEVELVTAIGALSAEQLALRPNREMWSVGMLTTHIVAARAGWFHGWMGHGPSALSRLTEWDENEEPTRTAPELVAALAETWAMVDDGLKTWTAAEIDETFKSPSNHDRPLRSRQWIIWHVLEHDLRHGGEISLILGMNGVKSLDF
jgi:uncharacterized damage-inducible protein DinB